MVQTLFSAKSQAEDSEESDSEADIDYKPERDEDWKKVSSRNQRTIEPLHEKIIFRVSNQVRHKSAYSVTLFLHMHIACSWLSSYFEVEK